MKALEFLKFVTSAPTPVLITAFNDLDKRVFVVKETDGPDGYGGIWFFSFRTNKAGNPVGNSSDLFVPVEVMASIVHYPGVNV